MPFKSLRVYRATRCRPVMCNHSIHLLILVAIDNCIYIVSNLLQRVCWSFELDLHLNALVFADVCVCTQAHPTLSCSHDFSDHLFEGALLVYRRNVYFSLTRKAWFTPTGNVSYEQFWHPKKFKLYTRKVNLSYARKFHFLPARDNCITLTLTITSSVTSSKNKGNS